MSILSKKYFHDAGAARKKLESIIWPDGPTCPHCGAVDRIYDLKKTRPGLRKCGHCRKQFTATVGTVFESSHIPLNLWFQAVYLMCASKKGISSHQLHRTLEVTYKTAWFMAHRIREAMRDDKMEIMGGFGTVVEVDETFIGRDKTKKKSTGYQHKYKILSLVERNGNARSFHIDAVNAKTIIPIVREQVDLSTHIMTDEAPYYNRVKWTFPRHDTVRHRQHEYARGEVSTNTVEGFFSIFKRGMKGIYQHCGEQHLQRYLAEFDFRYNERKQSDSERTESAMRGIVGKRLVYQGPCVKTA